MAAAQEEAEIRELTKCPICKSAFTDPRMLPCIHTFCFQCLKRNEETAQKKPGEKIPCPFCCKEFTIPANGCNGVQKNLFIENLMLQLRNTTITCDMCDIRNISGTEEIPTATMTCLECRDNYCRSCGNVHQLHYLSSHHQVVKIGDSIKPEMKRLSAVQYCIKHIQKPLDYYCAECKKIICVSCFVESHRLHDCKDVTTVDDEFRQVIEKTEWNGNVHQLHYLSSHHQVVKIGDSIKPEMKRLSAVQYCIKHIQKPLDYYCAECKKIICVSCFVESHRLHDCKDVTTVDDEFRQVIEKTEWNISNYAGATLWIRSNMEKRKADFLKEIIEKESAIRKRYQELKYIIDRDTKLILNELSVIKSENLKQIESELEEIDRSCTMLRSFESYCTKLRSKGSASDICSSVDQLIRRADELEKDHEAFIGRPLLQSVEVSFQATDLEEVLQRSNNNVLGKIKGTTTQPGNYAIVVGLDDGATITKDVIKINLQRPNEISTQKQIPAQMVAETTASVCCNILYITGTGDNSDEIWKYHKALGWMKCASLVEGRRRHSAAFVDDMLYICGGFADSDGRFLDTVEVYDVFNNKCTTVGHLVQGVESSGNCVPFRSSLYIFGGSYEGDSSSSHVQVYNTKQNTCTVLSESMPRPCRLMRAVLWERSVILLGSHTCFIFNFETDTWQEREQFKTDVIHFGLALENGRIFVIGGGTGLSDQGGKHTWKCRDDVRYVPLQNILDDKPIEWKIHGILPKPCFVYASANMRFPV